MYYWPHLSLIYIKDFIPSCIFLCIHLVPRDEHQGWGNPRKDKNSVLISLLGFLPCIRISLILAALVFLRFLWSILNSRVRTWILGFLDENLGHTWWKEEEPSFLGGYACVLHACWISLVWAKVFFVFLSSGFGKLENCTNLGIRLWNVQKHHLYGYF